MRPLSGTLARRNFVKVALGILALAGVGRGFSVERSRRRSASLIDVNVNLARWPLRHLPFDQTAALVGMLGRQGVVQAWAGSFDGLFHKDIGAANARLASECRRVGRGLLLPIGSVNPKLPDWEEELRRCLQVHRMRAIRLHPNYHGYPLADPEFGKLLQRAAENDLTVQLAVVMEDERMMHPLIRVEPVNTAPLAELIKRIPGLRLILLNALRTVRGEPLKELLAAGEVYVEIAMLEGVGGIENLLAQVPAERVLFGSHAPLFYFASALLKLSESALSEEQLQAIRSGNARGL